MPPDPALVFIKDEKAVSIASLKEQKLRRTLQARSLLSDPSPSITDNVSPQSKEEDLILFEDDDEDDDENEDTSSERLNDADGRFDTNGEQSNSGNEIGPLVKQKQASSFLRGLAIEFGQSTTVPAADVDPAPAAMDVDAPGTHFVTLSGAKVKDVERLDSASTPKADQDLSTAHDPQSKEHASASQAPSTLSVLDESDTMKESAWPPKGKERAEGGAQDMSKAALELGKQVDALEVRVARQQGQIDALQELVHLDWLRIRQQQDAIEQLRSDLASAVASARPAVRRTQASPPSHAVPPRPFVANVRNVDRLQSAKAWSLSPSL